MLLNITAPNDSAALLPILAFVEELASGLGMGERDRLSVRLAVEEAVANVIKHAFAPGERESFDILCQTDSSKLTITIREKGIPLRQCQVQGLEAASLETPGLGFRLMKGAVDRVVFRNLGRDGKEICLIKHLPLAAKCIGSGTADQPRSDDGSRSKAGSFEVRLLRPEDAAEVSRLAYKTYRYTYDDEFIYYPDQLVELKREGKIHSVVAISETGEVVGHAALKVPWPGVPVAEVGVLMVAPEYRSTRVALKLLQFLNTRAKEMGLEGAYAQAVSSHTISQKASALFGFKDCAILLGSFYSGISYCGIDAETSQKESAVVSYNQLTPRPARNIYPPARHRDTVRSMYDYLGLPANLPEPPSTMPKVEPVLHCSRDATTNTAVFLIESYGTTVVADVAEILRSLKLDRFDAAYLWLDLEHPFTASLADEFEQLGFFFAGVLPFGLSGRDCLILQYLNNLRIECSRVKVQSALGQKLLQYIKDVGNDLP